MVLFNDQLLAELHSFVDQAYELANTGVLKRRVELSRFSLEHTRMVRDLLQALNDCEQPGPDALPRQIRQARARQLKQELMAAMDSGKWGLAVAHSKAYEYFFNAMDEMIENRAN